MADPLTVFFVQLRDSIGPYLDMIYPNLSETLPTLLMTAFSIAVYGVLIYHFYRFLAKRDVFEWHLSRYAKNDGMSFGQTLFGWIKYGIAFPLVVFLWFGGFCLMLFLLAKNIPTEQVLLTSVVFVAAIRLASYYTENLSNDLAKMIPFALLGIAIIDPNFFSTGLLFQRIYSITSFIPQILSYFVFITLLEWILRVILFFKHLAFGKEEEEEPVLEE